MATEGSLDGAIWRYAREETGRKCSTIMHVRWLSEGGLWKGGGVSDSLGMSLWNFLWRRVGHNEERGAGLDGGMRWKI